jgi:hypothetical protein
MKAFDFLWPFIVGLFILDLQQYEKYKDIQSEKILLENKSDSLNNISRLIALELYSLKGDLYIINTQVSSANDTVALLQQEINNRKSLLYKTRASNHISEKQNQQLLSSIESLEEQQVTLSAEEKLKSNQYDMKLQEWNKLHKIK